MDLYPDGVDRIHNEEHRQKCQISHDFLHDSALDEQGREEKKLWNIGYGKERKEWGFSSLVTYVRVSDF